MAGLWGVPDMKCLQCGEEFEPSTKGQVFCSPAHRSKAGRVPRKVLLEAVRETLDKKP